VKKRVRAVIDGLNAGAATGVDAPAPGAVPGERCGIEVAPDALREVIVC